MRLSDRPSAETWIENIRRTSRCEWCAASSRLHRSRLCDQCDKIRKALLRIQKQLEDSQNTGRFRLERELEIAEAMRRDCVADGQSLRNIFMGEVDGLKLEREFKRLALGIASSEGLHHGIAASLDRAFSPAQRQVLGFLFWQIFHAQATRNRKSRAQGFVIRQLLERTR
jgi:hypothetical protein